MTLRRGSKDKTLVAAMQDMLKMAGFDPGPIDGIFGAKSEAAVKRFQTAAQLSSTGVFDDNTNMTLQACLQAGDCPKAPAVSTTRKPSVPSLRETTAIRRGTSFLSRVPTWAWVTAGGLGLVITLTIAFPPRGRKKR